MVKAETCTRFIANSTIMSLSIIRFLLLLVLFLHCQFTSSSESKLKFDFREDAEERIRTHFALNRRSAVKLALAEESIFYSFIAVGASHYKKGDKNLPVGVECEKVGTRFLLGFQQDLKSVGKASGFLRAKIVSENPLLLYRMIRRMHSIFPKIFDVCKVKDEEKELFPDFIGTINKILKSLKVTVPTELDLDDALLGLIRIHYVYGFNAINLRKGIFGDVETNVTLNFDDCLELAEYALDMEAKVLTYQWLRSAQVSLDEDEYYYNENKIFATSQLNNAWSKLLKFNGMKSKDLGQLHYIMKSFPQEEDLELFSERYERYAPCRGESSLSEYSKSKLKCFLQVNHPYWTLFPVKVEQLHSKPDVFQVYDFVGDETIADIKSRATPKLARSGVVSATAKSSEFHDARTSMNAWIYDDEWSNPGDYLNLLNKRVELFTGYILMKRGSSQALQFVDYASLGGHYDFHDDALSIKTLTEQDGDRIATFLVFLSDVRLGGHTAFSKLGIFAKPVKGSAILWHSLHRNGQADDRHTHAGCPVILGSKTVANKWILQYDNMLRYKCALDPNL